MSLHTRLISTVLFFIAVTFAGASYAADGVFTVTVGDFEVSMLSERQREGDTSILIGASDADIKKFIPSGKYPSAVSVFMIRTPEGVYLVDTGYGEKLYENMASLGVKPGDVTGLLVTHSHGDHIGGMVMDGKASLPNATVYVSVKEARWSDSLREKLVAYKGRVKEIEPVQLGTAGAPILKGVTAIAAYGHTPGHTVFLIESRGEKLLIWGDLTHAMAIQMPRPDVTVTYDSDPAEAAASRKAILDYVSKNEISVAGAHIAWPGIGRVEKDASGAGEYKFVY